MIKKPQSARFTLCFWVPHQSQERKQATYNHNILVELNLFLLIPEVILIKIPWCDRKIEFSSSFNFNITTLAE